MTELARRRSDGGRASVERLAAGALGCAVVLSVLAVQLWLRPYVYASGWEDFGLLGRAPAFLVGFAVPYLLLARGGALPRSPWVSGSFAEACFWALLGLWGLELLDLLIVRRVFDPGDLIGALLGIGAAWTFHRTVWSRRFAKVTSA